MMRLSEAIRLGAASTQQEFGELNFGPGVKATCALGAALYAIGAEVVELDGPKWSSNGRLGSYTTRGYVLSVEWQRVLSVNQTCPVCGMLDFGVQIVAHLNDVHRWTRERIADFVELLEPLECLLETTDARSQLTDTEKCIEASI